MKILLISDKPSPALYDHFNPDIFQGVNIVISCGDLPAYYLEFIITMLNVPCYYVPGNHDTAFVKKPPPGWDLLDGKVIDFQGLSIMGFGGSMKYKVGPFQYTEKEMKARLLRMKPKLWRKKNKIDILVTHAPAENLGDLEDLPHKGFKTFQYILDHYKPKYFLHGHVHLNYSRNPRQIKYGETEIINGYEYHIFDY
ncbi:MAG: metallophosphoesterase [Deltaproteobacteria bacterium]|mgnify:FL=1|nr:metallophosphoesterase [Deltaproteobacteria bacterium]